jgi:hypothetical protein
VIDIDEGCITLTVECWGGEEFKPSDAQRYKWQQGRWRILEAPEPAH